MFTSKRTIIKKEISFATQNTIKHTKRCIASAISTAGGPSLVARQLAMHARDRERESESHTAQKMITRKEGG